MSDNIKVSYIEDLGFDSLVSKFDKCVNYVSELEIPIKLKGYGYLLRIALNAIQDEQFEALLLRLKSNKELERNEGGYDYDFFENNNPKDALFNLIQYLKEQNLKINKIEDTIVEINERSYIVAEREDVDLLIRIRNKNQKTKCKVITNNELKKHIRSNTLENRIIIFYSFNGYKDFHFIYNIPNKIRLLLYSSEKDLYNRQLQIHKEDLENELTSKVRFLISGVKYQKHIEEEVKVSPTLQQTIARLEQLSNTGYEGYKDESDMALDDLEDKITYKISFSNNPDIKIESNETVFNDKGNLVKSWRLKIGDIVQIYPRLLADDLYQVAVEQEPEVFGVIDKQSQLWQNILIELDCYFNNKDNLHEQLKNHGLRVFRSTVNAYFDGKRKFPMYNSDLRAICSLADEVLENINYVKDIYPKIRQSKRLYNSTMIVLGRGVKQELKQFLKDETIGEILSKKEFTKEILRQYIDNYMPLLQITNIEEVNDEQ